MAYWTGFDYADPGCDPDYCNGISDESPTPCLWCNACSDDEQYFPFCSSECATAAEGDSEDDR